jgi:zinc transport system substrate-binding protein
MKTVFPFVVFLVLFFSFANGETIFVTIPPYASIVRSLAPEGVNVEALLDGNTDMHTFDLSLQKSRAVSLSKAWITVGEPFEERFVNVLKRSNPRFTSLDLRTCIDPILEGHKCCHTKEAHGAIDPHHWLSPKQMLKEVDGLAAFLVDLFPESKEAILQKHQALKEKLFALDQEVEQLLHPIKGKVVFVSHPAFGYLARDYGFKELGMQQEGKEPTAAKLKELIETARERKIMRIYSVKQHSLAGAAFLAKEVGAEVVVVDPMEEEYVLMIRKIASALGEK